MSISKPKSVTSRFRGQKPTSEYIQFWRDMIALFENSKSGTEDFCRCHGFSVSTFWRWRKILADNQAQFVEIAVVPEAKDASQSYTLPAKESAQNQVINLSTGDSLILTTDCDLTWLSGVISILRGEK